MKLSQSTTVPPAALTAVRHGGSPKRDHLCFFFISSLISLFSFPHVFFLGGDIFFPSLFPLICLISSSPLQDFSFNFVFFLLLTLLLLLFSLLFHLFSVLHLLILLVIFMNSSISLSFFSPFLFPSIIALWNLSLFSLSQLSLCERIPGRRQFSCRRL